MKAGGLFIFCVNDQREDRWFGVGCPHCGVQDERTPKPFSSKSSIYGETANQAGGQSCVTRQALCFLGGQFRKRETCGSKGVITSDCAGIVNRNEAIAYPAFDVLCYQIVQIAIERRRVAEKLLRACAGVRASMRKP